LDNAILRPCLGSSIAGVGNKNRIFFDLQIKFDVATAWTAVGILIFPECLLADQFSITSMSLFLNRVLYFWRFKMASVSFILAAFAKPEHGDVA